MTSDLPPSASQFDDLPATTHALPEVVWNRIRARVELSLSELEAVATRLFDEPLQTQDLDDVTGHAAALTEWLSHLGIGVGATLVRQMGEAISAPGAHAPEAVRIAALAEDVRSALATVPVALPPAVQSAPLVAIYGDPTSPVDGLLWNAVVQGLRVEHHDLGGLPLDTRVAPAAMIVAGTPDACALQLRLLKERHPLTPAVAVVDGLDHTARVALRKLAETVLPLGCHPATVGVEVRRLLLLVDTEPKIALVGCRERSLQAALAGEGASVREITRLEELAAGIRDGDVDVVIFGPDLTGHELGSMLQVLRADPGTRDAIRIVWGVPGAGVSSAGLFRLGADAVLPGGLSTPFLLAHIRAQVYRGVGAPPEISRGRRVLPWSGGRLILERLLQAAHRDDRATSVAMITLPPGADPSVLDAIQDGLASEFRTEDVVSRLDPQRQVVALQGVNRRTAVGRLEKVIQGSPLGRAGARAGVAEFPFDGRSVDELLRVASDAVGRSHEADGPVAVGADWTQEGVDTLDVMIVDTDETLTEVLVGQLGERGIGAIALQDGLDVLEMVVTNRRRLPRVLVLEFDITGLSGLQLLRRLREAGVMNRFRVMMMTSYSRESDLRTAFELGAAEVIEKPFQSVVFINRLRRLLES